MKPIEIHFYEAALRYWIKIVTSDENSWVRKLYDEIYKNINEISLKNVGLANQEAAI